MKNVVVATMGDEGKANCGLASSEADIVVRSKVVTMQDTSHIDKKVFKLSLLFRIVREENFYFRKWSCHRDPAIEK